MHELLSNINRKIPIKKIGTEPQSHRYTDTQIDRGRTLWLFIVEDIPEKLITGFQNFKWAPK